MYAGVPRMSPVLVSVSDASVLALVDGAVSSPARQTIPKSETWVSPPLPSRTF